MTSRLWSASFGILLLVLPSQLASQSCGVGGEQEPLVVGVVRDSDRGIPLVGARIRGEWVDAGGTGRDVTTRADADGRFAFCEVPRSTSLRFEARVRARSGRRVSVEVRDDRGDPLEVELEVPLGDPAALSGLSGLVVEGAAENPVIGAEVRLEGIGVGRVTNREGGFAFDRVPAGSYVLRVEHLGLAPFVDTVHLAPARPLQMRIPVATEPIPVDGIEVTVRSTMWMRRRADLFERMDRGAGHFITRAEIADRGEPPISSLLRSVPGITVQRIVVAGREIFYPVVRGSGIPALFVDGARASLEPGLGFGIDDFLARHIDVIEVQMGPATTPAGVPGSCSGCGVIHIWTIAP